MSKVCIVFDRLRAEEKMLQKEASELGHDALKTMTWEMLS
jgi:[lysine-biosynthesis-protein LysW]--L-2-aminoadipate ligase